MKVETINALRTEFADLTKKNEDRQNAVAEAKRDFTPEEKVESDKEFARLETINKQLTAHKTLASHAFAAKTNPNPADPEGQEAANRVEQTREVPGRQEAEQIELTVRDCFDGKKVKSVAFAKALNGWARSGRMERLFATITTATESGVLLPTEVDAPVIPSAPNTIREALAIYGQKALQTPTTATINLPVADATSGGKVAETATTDTENEPSLTESILLTPSTYESGSTWFSNQQLMAVDFDLMSATLPALEYSKELGLEDDVFTTMSGDGDISQSVATATISGFTYANLVAFNRILPKRYNAMKVIVLSKAAYTAAENLVTTTGYPILNALNPQNSSLKYFNGTPVLWSDYLASFGANNVVGMIFSLIGFRLRDCGQTQVQRYTQYPLKPSQTGFNLFGFHAFGYADSAVAKLTCPAS